MKKFIFLLILSTCISGYITYKHPGFFLELLTKTIEYVQEVKTGSNPTYVDEISLEERPILEFSSGISDHSIAFYQQYVPLEVFNPKKEKAPVVILIIGMNEFSSQEKLERYRERAREAMRDGMLVLFPHYIDANHLLWAETIRRTLDVAQSINNADPFNIGLIGYYEGSKIASYIGTVEKHRVNAISLNHSFLAEQADPEAFNEFPPTLMTTLAEGEEVLDQELLRDWLQHHKVQNEVMVHEPDDDLTLEDVDVLNWQKSLEFVQQHLMLTRPAPEVAPLKIMLNPAKVEVFNMNSGASLTGQLMHESEKSYLILTEENTHQMVSKSEVTSRQKLKAS